MSSRQACARRSLSTPRRARNSSLPAISKPAVLGGVGDDHLGQVVGQLGVLVARSRAPAPRSSRRRAPGAARPAGTAPASEPAATQRKARAEAAVHARRTPRVSARLALVAVGHGASWPRAWARTTAPRRTRSPGGPAVGVAVVVASGSSAVQSSRSRCRWSPALEVVADAVWSSARAGRGRSSRDSSRASALPSRPTVNARQTWPKPPRGVHGRRCRRAEAAAGPLVGRRRRLAREDAAASPRRACSRRRCSSARPGRRRAWRSWPRSYCRRTSPDRCRSFSQSASLSQGTVQRFRPSASSGSSSLMHLPTMQSMSDSHRNPSRPGRQMCGAARARELAEAEVVGRAAVVRGVAVGDADVGRVGGRGHELAAGTTAPAPHDEPPCYAALAAGSRGGRSAEIVGVGRVFA